MNKLLKHTRLNRRSYIFNLVFGYLFLFALGSLIMWPLGALNGDFKGVSGVFAGIVLVVTITVMVALVIACIILRSRDINMNPWLSLLVLVPYVGFAYSLYLIFAPSKESEKWGVASKKLSILGLRRS